MFGCGPKKRRSSSFNDDEKKQSKKSGYDVKLLLLGTGESGKTTILKQMKLLHINEYTNEERQQQIAMIRQNVFESIHDIVDNMDKISPPVQLANDSNSKSKDYILGLDKPEFSDDYFNHVTNLWSDAGVKATLERSNEYQLIDCASYFLERLDDIRKSDYLPTTQDMLFCRKKTINITELKFKITIPKTKGGGEVNFMVYDVGGQRGERKKWIRVFEGINAVLFLIAASDFDQRLKEEETKNRLEEAFELFDDISTSTALRDSGMIVFLNKQDLLKKKIENGHKLEKYFPEFAQFQSKKAGANDDEYKRARDFMETKVQTIAKKPMVIEQFNVLTRSIEKHVLPPRNTYIHHTIATDTKNIKLVLESLQEMIIETLLKDTNIVF